MFAVRPRVEDRALEQRQPFTPVTAVHHGGCLRDEGHRDDLIEAERLGECKRPVGQADCLGHLLVAERGPSEDLDEEGRRLLGFGAIRSVPDRSAAARVASASAASRNGRATSIAVAIWALAR